MKFYQFIAVAFLSVILGFIAFGILTIIEDWFNNLKINSMIKLEELKQYHREIRLGDKLEWIFKLFGITYLFKKIYPNCKCEQRKDWLNGELNLKRK